MKGIFWNSIGLADLAKRRFLSDTLVEQKLDFMALLETGRANFTPQFLSTISRGGGLILTGTVYLQGGDPEGYYLG